MALILGGLASMFPGMFLFGSIVKAGGGSRLAVVEATTVLALGFAVASIACGWSTLRLQPKP
jgi:hypothetical protein